MKNIFPFGYMYTNMNLEIHKCMYQTTIMKTEMKYEKSLPSDMVLVSRCYHGQISCSVAEERLKLVNVDQCYLARESDVKPGKYVLSYLVNGSIEHYYIRKCPVNDREASMAAIAYLIQGIDNCKYPVNPPEENTPEEKIYNYPPLTCYVCAAQFANEGKLLNHKKTHKLKECTNCSKFILDNSFNYHIARCSETPLFFQCDQCDKKLTRNDSLKKHMNLHYKNPFSCKLCGRKFETNDILQKHKVSMCAKMLKCTVCDKYYTKLSSLNRHLKLHDGKDGMHIIKKKRQKGRRFHTCPEPGCSFQTKDKRRLENHIPYKHLLKNPKLYACEACDSTYDKPWKLKRHEKTCNQSNKVILFI